MNKANEINESIKTNAPIIINKIDETIKTNIIPAIEKTKTQIPIIINNIKTSVSKNQNEIKSSEPPFYNKPIFSQESPFYNKPIFSQEPLVYQESPFYNKPIFPQEPIFSQEPIFNKPTSCVPKDDASFYKKQIFSQDFSVEQEHIIYQEPSLYNDSTVYKNKVIYDEPSFNEDDNGQDNIFYQEKIQPCYNYNILNESKETLKNKKFMLINNDVPSLLDEQFGISKINNSSNQNHTEESIAFLKKI
jgi:hypothetical protein